MKLPLRVKCLHFERAAIAKKHAKRTAKNRARRAVRHAKWKAR